MSDIFASNDDPFVGGEQASDLTDTPSFVEGQNAPDATPAPLEPTDSQATVPDRGTEEADVTGQASPGAPEPQLSDEDRIKVLEQEAEAALADERTPKW